MMRIWESERKEINASYSIGLLLQDSGVVVDTIEGMPAAKAGIGPGMKVIAVNGRRFSGEVFRNALQGTKNGKPLELLVENTEFFTSFKIDYQGGEKYPHLVREESKPDLLSEIAKAK